MTPTPDREIVNFGGNVRFQPKAFYTPRTEAEVLEILDRHRSGSIRVLGARHSWNAGIVSEDASVDLRHLDRVVTSTDDEGQMWAIAGGGCPLKVVLKELREQSDVTLPSMGVITEQSIAGAISTGTHGSGRHSLSHYMEEIRVAAYDSDTGKAVIHTFTDGPELRAARCAIGCMGIILSVRFRCVTRYVVSERMGPRDSLDEVLARAEEFPLQQFYLIPHLWRWYSQERRVPAGAAGRRRSRWATPYRWYWVTWLDVSFHLLLKLLTTIPRSAGAGAAVIGFYRHWFPLTVPSLGPVEDWSEDQLVMKHDLFRHVEIELFVPAGRVQAAAGYVEAVLQVFAGTVSAAASGLQERLQTIDAYGTLESSEGIFTHHYPVCFRQVLADDTMLSMSCGAAEPYYAISFISYTLPLEPFERLAVFLAETMARLFAARPHWGKYFPLAGDIVHTLYPELDEFRAICHRVDPAGVFRNPFVARALGFDGRRSEAQETVSHD